MASVAVFESGPGARMMVYELATLLANLMFIQNNNEIKKVMTATQSKYTMAQSEAVQTAMECDARSMMLQAYGAIAGAVASAIVVGVMEVMVTRTNSKIEDIQNRSANLKAICAAPPKPLEIVAEHTTADAVSKAKIPLSDGARELFINDGNPTNKLLSKKTKAFTAEMDRASSASAPSLSLDTIRNDIRNAPPETVESLRSDLEKGLTTEEKTLENLRTKQTQQQSSLQQLFNALGTGATGAAGASQKELQAVQESQRYIAEYLMQIFSKAGETFSKNNDNTINQIQSLLQMEGAAFAANSSRA